MNNVRSFIIIHKLSKKDFFYYHENKYIYNIYIYNIYNIFIIYKYINKYKNKNRK